jgi:hypothetical protein
MNNSIFNLIIIYTLFNRCAIKNASTSSVWSAIEKSLKSVLLELFDDYDELTDAEQDLSLYPDYPNYNYLCLLISSFEKNSDLFKANYIKLLETRAVQLTLTLMSVSDFRSRSYERERFHRSRSR